MAEDTSRELTIRRRNLPHWQAGGSTYFVTWRMQDGIDLTMDERLTVLKACRRLHGVRYFTGAVVVMPDHVHLLIRPFEKEPGRWWNLSELLKGMKGASARAINLKRGRKGPLWQDESFDRIMREGEFEQKYRYIRGNPYRRRLVKENEVYPALWITCDVDGWMNESMAKPWHEPED